MILSDAAIDVLACLPCEGEGVTVAEIAAELYGRRGMPTRSRVHAALQEIGQWLGGRASAKPIAYCDRLYQVVRPGAPRGEGHAWGICRHDRAKQLEALRGTEYSTPVSVSIGA